MKIAVASDIHAGLGEDDRELRELQGNAVQAATRYLIDQDMDVLVLNGDTTDHLANSLSAGTNKEISLNVLAPLAALMLARRCSMNTILNAGNTDWVLAEPDSERKKRKTFFDYTGFPEDNIYLPNGGLLFTEQNEEEDTTIVFHHGHGLKPKQWGHKGPMNGEQYRGLWDMLRSPTREFLNAISATSGSHRMDYLKACVVGSVVKLAPGAVRDRAVNVASTSFTKEYEQHYARMLACHSLETEKRVLGVMGHTHNAGIRRYDDIVIINTGTTGAKPNPLQQLSDPKGHVAMIDLEKGSYELVQTFDARHPNAKPEVVGQGEFSNL